MTLPSDTRWSLISRRHGAPLPPGPTPLSSISLYTLTRLLSSTRACPLVLRAPRYGARRRRRRAPERRRRHHRQEHRHRPGEQPERPGVVPARATPRGSFDATLVATRRRRCDSRGDSAPSMRLSWRLHAVDATWRLHAVDATLVATPRRRCDSRGDSTPSMRLSRRMYP